MARFQRGHVLLVVPEILRWTAVLLLAANIRGKSQVMPFEIKQNAVLVLAVTGYEKHLLAEIIAPLILREYCGKLAKFAVLSIEFRTNI